MHISETFKLLTNPKFNILSKLNPSEFRLLRKRMIESVLATDMSNHSKYLTALKNKITIAEIKEGNDIYKIIEDNDPIKRFENQQLVLNNIIHAADISNPAKLSSVYRKWVDLVFVEFFDQGDLEKKENLTVTILCDRVTTDISKAQIGFIKFVVKPTFEAIGCLSPEIKTYIEYINKNLKMYEDIVKNSTNNNINNNTNNTNNNSSNIVKINKISN